MVARNTHTLRRFPAGSANLEREKERERERERERWDKKGGIVESRIRVFVCLIVVA